MRPITVEMLREAGACEGQLEEFAKRWPEGVVPTEEVCLSVANVFDWTWAREQLLPLWARRGCARDMREARERYRSVCDAAMSRYFRSELTEVAWVAIERVAESARRCAFATAFARAWAQQENGQ